MKTTDIPHLRGEEMPEAKAKQAVPKPEAAETKPELTPASESGNPAVQQLLAELATLRANGAGDDAQDIVTYLAELGFSA